MNKMRIIAFLLAVAVTVSLTSCTIAINEMHDDETTKKDTQNEVVEEDTSGDESTMLEIQQQETVEVVEEIHPGYEALYNYIVKNGEFEYTIEIGDLTLVPKITTTIDADGRIMVIYSSPISKENTIFYPAKNGNIARFEISTTLGLFDAELDISEYTGDEFEFLSFTNESVTETSALYESNYDLAISTVKLLLSMAENSWEKAGVSMKDMGFVLIDEETLESMPEEQVQENDAVETLRNKLLPVADENKKVYKPVDENISILFDLSDESKIGVTYYYDNNNITTIMVFDLLSDSEYVECKLMRPMDEEVSALYSWVYTFNANTFDTSVETVLGINISSVSHEELRSQTGYVENQTKMAMLSTEIVLLEYGVSLNDFGFSNL